MFFMYFSVALCAACDTDAECSETNANSECQKIWIGCDNGQCACKSGYEGDSCREYFIITT